MAVSMREILEAQLARLDEDEKVVVGQFNEIQGARKVCKNFLANLPPDDQAEAEGTEPMKEEAPAV